MVEATACDVHRWRLVHFPGFLYHSRAVFYTVRKPSRRAYEFLREAPTAFFALLFLSIVACALIFCLINYCSGRQPLNGIQEVALAFVSTAMLFSYPVPQRFERVLAGRIVLFCWMVGGFSLATYLQSLLTSSLSSIYGWDADDTIDKLYPKVASGKVLPCVLRGTFMDTLLKSGDKQGIIGAMAAAQQRSPNKNSTVSDTQKGCTDKVVRGSHVFLSVDFEECNLAIFGNMVTVGKETIYTLYMSTPVRKYFTLRATYGRLVARIFETHLQSDDVRALQSNCSRFGDVEDLEEFMRWNAELAASREKRLQLKRQMRAIGGDNTPQKTRRILKYYLSPDIAVNFSWYGAKGKKKFCELEFCKVMCALLTENKKGGRVEGTLSEVEKATMKWLAHAQQRLDEETGNKK
ncbi:hypothetical protein HPB47_005517 [Ixodes persulcatus]|uniref:Uncharacterized protein n=1 Tax=Ixodes persulcatus TaxID=34615 RepID=A0AC60PDM0_IXOPE|nr:hypothetical protein HPB47_005517 [Ixodes persulcatus]